MINQRSCVIFWKSQNYRRDISLVFARAQGERTELTTKEHPKTFCVDENIPYPICGSEYMTVSICQNS